MYANKMTLISISWMRKLYWNNDAFKSSTKFDHIKEQYYWSQTTVRCAVGYLAHLYSFKAGKPLKGSPCWPGS